jgi:cyclopropane-fatty-acyl-phospholipid synthase
MLLARLLRRLIKVGHLTVIDATGDKHEFGKTDGAPRATIRLHEKALHTKLFLNPNLYLGEAYMDGTLTLEDGTLDGFFEVIGANLELTEPGVVEGVGEICARMVRPFIEYNPVWRAKRNAALHYDLSDTFFNLFLDRDRQYSCAYFEAPNYTLEQAQEAKKRHLASKLLLEPGCKVLDIGSGWGGLALYLAQEADADVTGLTLSEEQHKGSNERAAKAGLADRVRFHLRDYRQETGRYDRIISVGMFEHVGVQHYPAFFKKMWELLDDDGIALLHSIGRTDGPGMTTPFIRKYIFPGGYSPALSEVLAVIERSKLYVTDIEILRLHYAETLKEWLRRFRDNRDTIAKIYDERFCRMWEYFLASSEMGFRSWCQIVFQIQLSKRFGTVPIARDYMYLWERAHTADASLLDRTERPRTVSGRTICSTMPELSLPSSIVQTRKLGPG